MFNEGVDLPDVDTVMMLRPTESRILWLQQFGRGLRKARAASSVTVIDYIGNHRIFLLKPQTLFSLGTGDQADPQLARAAWTTAPIEICRPAARSPTSSSRSTS